MKTIGEKIREERLKAGMTQKQLSGDYITRNMLSAIESGKATPSLPTLINIANVLDLPPEYFLSETSDIFQYKKIRYISKIKYEFSVGNYKECIRLTEKFFPDKSEYDDELSYICALSFFRLGKKALMNGNLHTATALFDESKSMCEATIYDTSKILLEINLYHPFASDIQLALISFDEELCKKQMAEISDADFFMYVTDNSSFKFENELYQIHISARQLIKTYNYESAISLLSKIEEEKASERINMILLFRVYTDMETCYRELRDFENAYRYSTKRLSLLESFKS